jgi:hypothetical protein
MRFSPSNVHLPGLIHAPRNERVLAAENFTRFKS